jgi:hypothetical protein
MFMPNEITKSAHRPNIIDYRITCGQHRRANWRIPKNDDNLARQQVFLIKIFGQDVHLHHKKPHHYHFHYHF